MDKAEKGFWLDPKLGYFQNLGVNVMAFDDIYPAGHQSGVSILMHGSRVATNGDLRFEQTPGQWQPVPRQKARVRNEKENTIVTTLGYPDPAGHLTGFNPMIYPDYRFDYRVTVKGDGGSVIVTVDLNEPIPEEYVGKLCFDLELFPGALFGKPWIMDGKAGIFPPQPNGPTLAKPTNYLYTDGLPIEGVPADRERLSGGNRGYNPIIADDIIAEPYAVGHRFTLRPDDPLTRLTVESGGAELKLYDGRMNHNNGWFVLSSEVPAGAVRAAIRWTITPNVVKDWLYRPVVQVSQVGYHPAQPKTAVVELDSRDESLAEAVLYRIAENGETPVGNLKPREWGRFLRYRYLKFDFSPVTDEGLYRVRYGGSDSALFRIAKDVYERGVWQPVLEYFLPVQMCHMRVNEKYRVWHGHCHGDDARMAPTNCSHIDGYVQGPSTLTPYRPGDTVPGLDAGGWHDAGDFDLRIESQMGEVYVLTAAFEEFGVNYDATTIDQQAHVVEIHQPDGKNDILQQIEHGLLSVVGGWRSLGRLYRGIICGDLRQYVLLGDSAAMTGGVKGDGDDRWVFTEDDPARELMAAGQLAAASRAMRSYDDALSREALEIARELYRTTRTDRGVPCSCASEDAAGSASPRSAKLFAAAELLLTTGGREYREHLASEMGFITQNIDKTGWIASRAAKAMGRDFTDRLRPALERYKTELDSLCAETPYGIPYRPHIWGAGWSIQRMGFEYYFLHRAFPDIFGPAPVYSALNFVLGCHPGSNTASFASGVGARSATVAYGLNRADWSYIPGGVVSGTALIRPDFPELLDFPFLWQQKEYVIGGGSSHYMFLVLAAQHLLDAKTLP